MLQLYNFPITSANSCLQYFIKMQQQGPSCQSKSMTDYLRRQLDKVLKKIIDYNNPRLIHFSDPLIEDLMLPLVESIQLAFQIHHLKSPFICTKCKDVALQSDILPGKAILRELREKSTRRISIQTKHIATASRLIHEALAQLENSQGCDSQPSNDP